VDRFAAPSSFNLVSERMVMLGNGDVVVAGRVTYLNPGDPAGSMWLGLVRYNAAGQRVTIDYLGVNGTDAKEFDTSYGKDKATFNLDDGSIIKGMVEGLSGVKVGSRVLIAVPPKDGYGTAGQPDAGIGPTDTLLFVIDVKSASTVLKRAAGAAVKPKSGLPKVTLEKKTGKPTITLPKSKAPATLVVQPLINGTGAKVIKGQTITVHYTGVIWPGGKVFDSSWAKDTPATFPIGIGKVITGWDQGLVGKKVGSQILLVIPPDKGYGVAGKPEANIKGTDTLVFVVDILDAA
jgi:peptidylprolyl isomerase